MEQGNYQMTQTSKILFKTARFSEILFNQLCKNLMQQILQAFSVKLQGCCLY